MGSNHVFNHNVPEKYFQLVESTGQTGQSIIMPWSSLTHEFDQSSPEWEVRRLFNFSVLCIILLGLQELQILSDLLFHYYCTKRSGQYISLHWDYGWLLADAEKWERAELLLTVTRKIEQQWDAHWYIWKHWTKLLCAAISNITSYI